MTQKKALTVLKTGANVFLTGESGAGKTYTINLFTSWLEEKGIPYAVTASTGIAATHIGGITIHSFSGLGIKEEITQRDLDNIEAKPRIVDQIMNCRVLIIDEISMLDATVLDNVEKILTHVRRTTLTGEAFGGLQVVFVGDFYQLPPVNKKGEAKFAFESASWNLARPVTCYITEQHRQAGGEFVKILNDMRNGIITLDQKKMLIANNVKEIPKTKLFTHNTDVDALNHQELAKVKGQEYIFWMSDTKNEWNEFLIEGLKKNCLSPEKLVLKIGALVMFTRNNFEDGYVNGTLGTVVDIVNNKPVVETKDGKEISVDRAKWSIGEGEGEKASISQFPLRLAWAITVHKSQGMSLDSAVIDLSRCFEYGQGYVAISRVRSLDGLFIEGINKKAFEMHPQVIDKDLEFRLSSDEMDAKFAEEL